MIRLSNLTVCYQQRPAIHHISGLFDKGSLTAIVGPNGAGKSTLLKAIVGLLPSSGKIVTGGPIGYLPQLVEIDRAFPLTVAELALSGHWLNAGNTRQLDKAARNKAYQALEQMGLADFSLRPIATLSGGQLQRARFARLIVQDSPIMLLDEPFNSVDSRTTEILLGVLKSWHAEGKTLISVEHDLELVRRHFPQSLLLAREVIAWGNSEDALQSGNLTRAQHIMVHWHNEAEWCAQP